MEPLGSEQFKKELEFADQTNSLPNKESTGFSQRSGSIDEGKMLAEKQNVLNCRKDNFFFTFLP